MYVQRRLRSACAPAQSDKSLLYPYGQTLRPWLDRMRSVSASAQTDLNLHWVHMSESTFSDVAARPIYGQPVCICFLILDTYDCVAISGGMGESHIPCNAIHELIRVVKPGRYHLCVRKQTLLVHGYLQSTLGRL